MGFNLSCVRIECKAESLLDKRLRDLSPVQIWISKVMSIIVSYCSIKFPIYFSLLQKSYLMCKTIGKISILFSKCGR